MSCFKTCLLLLSSLWSLFLIGCGPGSMPALPKVYPVKCKIVLPDGQPLSYARVCFTPRDRTKGAYCEGYVNSDGTFDKLVTHNGAMGAMPGKYLVHLEPVGMNDKGLFKGPQKDMPTIPEKYRAPDTSELIFEVKAADNDLGTITLK